MGTPYGYIWRDVPAEAMLVCKTCRCVVPNRTEDWEQHDEWHRELGSALNRIYQLFVDQRPVA